MKLLNWVRFTWDLNSLACGPVELPKHYTIAPASKTEDEKALRKVLSCSFLLDPAWNPAIAEVMHSLQSWLDRAFVAEEITCLALRHGTRIIGASVLCLDPAAENHFAPGPCVLMEYRNRGFGTQLLQASLQRLKDSGLSRASGIARELSPVAKFLYPKYNSVAEAAKMTVPLAA
ncbi:MAG TPA: GNAT family N-acetyltransferase [Chthoniobacterales bacterium]|nr:GNAT family N-acetyltransferase [Chthoniobacterales bacterium]